MADSPFPCRLVALLRAAVGCATLAVLCVWTAGAASSEPPLVASDDSASGTIDYETQIKPLLFEKCYACHGVLRQEASLRLETRKLILAGGDSGAPVIPGDAASSLIIERVTADDDMRMPPEGEGSRLTADEIHRLTTWINQGAIAPDEPTPQGPEDHWAFQVVSRPAIPSAGPSGAVDGTSAANPIDAFLDAARRERNLSPVGPAPPRVLLRRLYLDLVGLPPSREQLDAFERDPSETAYRETVQRLLASPQYGERWGRHWMDIWRYSDWYGLGDQLRNSAKHIWQWRDWIIESLNADKGYDRMILEMLAADEIAPEDADALRATGFLARHYYLFNRTTWMDETIEHTSQAFLGLTMQCAKCHAHKYDPISHEDYYRMRAFFEPYQVRIDAVPGETDLNKLGLPRVFDAHPEAQTFLHLRGDEKRPDETQPLMPGVPEVLGGVPLEITPVALPPRAHRPRLRPHVLRDHLRDADAKISSAQTQLATAIRQRATLGDPPAENGPSAADAPASEAAANEAPASEAAAERAAAERAVTVAEQSLEVARLYRIAVETAGAAEAASLEDPQPEHAADRIRAATTAYRQYEVARTELVLLNAADDAARATAQADVEKARRALADQEEGYLRITASLKQLEGPDETDESRRAPYPRTSTGRRSALARWIAHRENPLTARVAVNHIWMRHFGQPLVEPVTDFGLRTKAPEQQPLLDWLAVEFMDSGWSMKHLHRIIVTSHAYRLSSTSRDAAARTIAADPENRYYWRRMPQRMESQVVRDALLKLAGRLDTALGGPPLAADGQSELNRRSLYFRHSRDDQHPFLAMFDDADILRCYRRSETVVPQQALALANSALALEAGREIAQRVAASAGSTDHAFAIAAFETVLAVEPTEAEVRMCVDAMIRTREALAERSPEDATRRAQQNLVHALLNHNDFITIR